MEKERETSESDKDRQIRHQSKYIDDMTCMLAWQNHCLMQYSWSVFQMANYMSFQNSLNNQYQQMNSQQHQQPQRNNNPQPDVVQPPRRGIHTYHF